MFKRQPLKAHSAVLLMAFLGACATNGKKPVSLMIFTSAAMKAAERSQSERLAPDLYRRAENEFWRARKAYVAKDFETAHKSAVLARKYAEQAEKAAELKAATAGLDD